MSEFHTDGHDVTVISIVATEPGQYDFELSNPHFGAQRWLGLELDNSTKGVRIDSVHNSAAQKVGIRTGDFIVGFNGKPVANPNDVLKLLSKTHIGDKVPLDIERDGKRMTIVIEVAERSPLSS